MSLALTLVFSALTLACTADEPAGHCESFACEPVDPMGTHTTYVVDSVFVADTAADAAENAFDVDGVGSLHDNALGQALATVFGQINSDMNQIVEDMMLGARMVHLIDVQALALDNASGVGVDVFLGADTDDDASDNFSGSESFGIVDAVVSETMIGDIVDGRLRASLGTIPLQLALPDIEEPFVLSLTGARIEAEFDGDRLVGHIGGGLLHAHIDEQLMPIVHTAIVRSVDIDCDQEVCIPGTSGATFIDIFDADKDGDVSFSEVADHELVRMWTAPDIDLLDIDGVLDPAMDGIPDALSFAVEFTAVPARF